MRILIVEDEWVLAQMMSGQLERAGYEMCGIVASGEEAIKRAKSLKPDAVLMDIRLAGEIDGIEAARLIGKFSAARIVFTSGYSSSDVRQRAEDLKPAAFLAKPVDMAVVKRVLGAPGPLKAKKKTGSLSVPG